jgi:hypothetical protein
MFGTQLIRILQYEIGTRIALVATEIDDQPEVERSDPVD